MNPLQMMELIEALRAENDSLKRNYAAVVEREQEYHNFFESTRDAIVVFNRELRLIEANPAAVGLLGYLSEKDMRGIPIESIFGDPTVLDQLLKVLLSTGKIENLETTLCCKARDRRWPVVIGSGFVHLDRKEQPKHFEFVFTDISKRKQAEEEIREKEALYRSIYQGMSVGVARVSLGLTILSANTAYCRMLGSLEEDLVGRNVRDIIHPDMVEETLQKGEGLIHDKRAHFHLEERFVHKQGHVVHAILDVNVIHDAKGKPSYLLCCVVDITRRKELEARLLESQKLEAVGTLAGGVAHDFNNLLMGIQGRISLISVDLPAIHPAQEHIRVIETHIGSAKRLTYELLGFARGGKYELKHVDMKDLVQNTASMFGRTKKELQIHTRLDDVPMVIEADANQIEQVLLNLYINAWQAMPEGGELFLDARVIAPDDHFCDLYQTPHGPYVTVTVRDTGVGMDEVTLKRVFDPFYTTKEKGRGTGLGLASAYGIIKNHGGVITVQSEPCDGSAFTVFLPASNAKAVHVDSEKTEMKRGSETILLVDDEEIVLDVAQTMLEHLGYAVVTARSGEEAVETVKTMGKDIDLVILDFIMPGMDGGRTFNCLREIRPNILVMLSTGYGASDRTKHIVQAGRSRVIQKPFSIEELSLHVRTILDECRDSP